MPEDGLAFLAGAADDREGFGIGDSGHQMAGSLDYAGLLSGYTGDGVAKMVGVVHADGGDRAHQRSDDIGGVEAAAQTDLQDRKINPLLHEVQEG